MRRCDSEIVPSIVQCAGLGNYNFLSFHLLPVRFQLVAGGVEHLNRSFDSGPTWIRQPPPLRPFSL